MTALLMLIIEVLFDAFRQGAIIQNVPDVVQQCRRNQGRGCTGFLGQRRGLKSVLQLIHALSAILLSTPLVKTIRNLLNDLVH